MGKYSDSCIYSKDCIISKVSVLHLRKKQRNYSADNNIKLTLKTFEMTRLELT
jgi:hypothetical protein